MRIPILLVTLLIAGCSGLAPEPQDGPGRVIDDPMAIPDAEPQDMPLSQYGNPERYEVFGRTYRVMDSADDHRERGIASWYGRKFQGRRTSSGEPYDMYAMTAAHKHLPLPTWVEVRHLDNNRSIVVKVNDRGPFADNRIIDLSYAAAAKLGMLDTGTAPVAIRTVTAGEASEPAEEPADGNESDYWIQLAAFRSAGNAERLAKRLRAAELSATPTIRQGEDGLHRVRLGPLPDADSVDRLSAELDSARFPAGHVIIPDKPSQSD
ncbi:septal ring lytic transglycosylase RlpA family protein [Spiribacter vilamensis]|uniref:Endolytic peptidoglycan transglycosylase RlpA n=1 Tax=Spiribacter vilamensis TaxID=531306 RepID=A0A4Q8CY76_9GAMM|nr:septal ring lytic transglycosylase RlpA family protein [Spiribacter vilamensis]RZU97840.1 rare lipoprotein A [Spiribacter vilamensis]